MPSRSSRAPVASLLRVAAVQCFVGGDLAANMATIHRLTHEAVGRGAQLAVFPECAVTGYPPEDWSDGTARPTERQLREALNALRSLARTARLTLVVGTAWQEGKRWFNSLFAIDQRGRILARYDKIHLTGGDAAVFTPGSALGQFHCGRAVAGLQICLDWRYPEPWRVLRAAGVQLVCHSANASKGSTWKVPVLEGTLRCRAAENDYCIVSANAAGPLQMAVSMIVTPDGLIAARANQDREEVIVAELNLAPPEGGFFAGRRQDLFLLRPTPRLRRGSA